jgi:hypothetical protein
MNNRLSLWRGAIVAALFVGASAATSSAATIAYWNNNSNGLPNGGLFGYAPGDFPQAADVGTGSLDLAMFETATEVDASGNTKYVSVESFAGSTVNAQGGDPAGGSLSPEGGTSNGSGGFLNNGMKILYTIPTTGYGDIKISWAQRGTSSGFTSRAFAYSTDGGSVFTPVSYTGDTGVLSSTFGLVSIDLSAVSAIDNLPSVIFQVTLDGATTANGNNRFDNMLFEGTAIPEPTTLALGGLALLGVVAARRRG